MKMMSQEAFEERRDKVKKKEYDKYYRTKNKELLRNKKHDYYIKILEINLTEEVALNKEKEYILKFGRRQFKNGGTLVNLTDGGDGVSGKIFTDEEREEYMEEESRRDLRDRMTEDIRNDMMF